MKSILDYKYKTDLPLTPDNRINWSAILMEMRHGGDVFNLVNAPSPENEAPQPLTECSPEEGLRHFAGTNGARQMQMIFDEIQHKHHPDGFETDED